MVVVAMFGVVAIIAILGKSALNLENEEYLRWFKAVTSSDWVVPIVVATFVIGSFLGVPQWALIASMVVAFGPRIGMGGAWVCTMLSASVNFWMARWIGAERVAKFGGQLVNRIASVVRRNGFVTSFVVRLVPTGPFILVNMAAGVSKMKFPHFLAGTALGIIPKIGVVTLIATGILSDDQSDWIRLGLVLMAGLFILIMLAARKHLRRFVETNE